MIILCAALVAGFFGAQTLRGAKPEVSASLSKDSIGIGDQITLDVKVVKDVMQITDFPAFEEGMMTEQIYILSESPVDTVSDGRVQTLSKSYTLTTFKAGVYDIGQFPVLYIDKNIVDTLLSADRMKLLVTTFDIDLQNDTINPIKRPENTPFLGQEIFGYIVWGLIGLCVLASIAWIAFYLRRKYGKKADREEGAVQEPPHVTAIRELEQLHHKKLWQNNRHKQYYSTLTDILREYIGRRYGTSVMEKTTDEIMEVVKGFELDGANNKRLGTLLGTADLVKFAKYIPDADYNEKAYTDAYYFVEDTKEAPAEEESGDENTAAERNMGGDTGKETGNE